MIIICLFYVRRDMALVMLPCDLPWWPAVQRNLIQVAKSQNSEELIDCMLKILNLCNVSLDPDEAESSEAEIFDGLIAFLEELPDDERCVFFNFTLPCIAHRALDLKRLRPQSGLHFSLQQQSDRVEFCRDFVASLMAHCFFSTFPKRTLKTHPTLQDFNFSKFFQFLHLKHQKCKLRSFLHYFNLLEKSNSEKKIVVSRQVMNSAQWLTLEDWLDCKMPLCPLLIKSQGDVNSVGTDHIIVCSTRTRIGGAVLTDGNSADCIQLTTSPEMLILLLYVESLEDNEVLVIDGVLQVSKISDPKGNCTIDLAAQPQLLTFCCFDPDDYGEIPLLQYQRDSILRELNKSLLGFRQKPNPNGMLPRRLSPIGESFSSTPEKDLSSKKGDIKVNTKMSTDRKFIILGSSGECLPVLRNPSRFSSCHSNTSSENDFHSARTSFTDDDVEDDGFRRYSCQLDKDDRRSIFAERLKEALDRADIASTESEEEEDVRVTKRDGSCGFVLDDESVHSFHEKRRDFLRQGTSASSKYSFTTNYSSELEAVYEQLSRWLDEDDSVLPQSETTKVIRERAVIHFAGNLLKRTLSESFVGVPVGDGIHMEIVPPRNVKRAARSLSLELARHKSKLAAQLASVVMHHNDGLFPVATYNCGCSSRNGEPQLKLLVQWIAASVALLPHIIYFTASNPNLNKLDTVCRVLLDRQWSVGELISSILRYSEAKLLGTTRSSGTLFEQIICNDDRYYQKD